jgi:rod shape-determining protein MreD
VTSLLMFFALVAGAVLQAVFPTWRWLGQAPAPVLMGVVLYYALSHSRRHMLQAAIVAGLLQDALGMIPLGYSSFCFVVAALLVSKFKDIVFVHETLTHMSFGALASGAVTLALYGLLSKEDLVSLPGGWAALKTVGSMLLGAVVVPFVFEILESLDRTLGNTEAREL